jgi:hypothetical protein
MTVTEDICSLVNVMVSAVTIACMLIVSICWENMMGGAMVGLLILNVDCMDFGR